MIQQCNATQEQKDSYALRRMKEGKERIKQEVKIRLNERDGDGGMEGFARRLAIVRDHIQTEASRECFKTTYSLFV